MKSPTRIALACFLLATAAAALSGCGGCGLFGGWLGAVCF